MLNLVVLFSFISAAFATVGVDYSQATSLSSLQCAKNNGYNFAIARVYKSNGAVDANGPSNINNAWNAGFKYVDGYIFPCYSCGNPAKQMDDTINYLASHAALEGLDGVKSSNATLGARVGMLWIDVEGTQYWSSSTSSNVNFIKAMADQGAKRGVSLGVYTSKSQWTPITGGSTALSKYPLWYAHYDNVQNFSDFVAFGGWSKPAMKQYAGDVSFCSAGWDKNWY